MRFWFPFTSGFSCSNVSLSYHLFYSFSHYPNPNRVRGREEGLVGRGFRGGPGQPWSTQASTYLLLLSELDLHLLVAKLVFANAVSSDEVAADISQLWVLLSRLFDKAKNK